MLPKLAKQSGFQAWKLAGLANARRRCARRETCAHILNAHMRAKKTRAANPSKLPLQCTILRRTTKLY